MDASGDAPGAQPEQTHAPPLPFLLNYERLLVEELIDEDALCIMASGLGWHRIVSVFVRLHYYQQPGVVLILGCAPWQVDLICKELQRHDAGMTPPVEITNEVGVYTHARARARMHARTHTAPAAHLQCSAVRAQAKS